VIENHSVTHNELGCSAVKHGVLRRDGNMVEVLTQREKNTALC